MVFSDRYTVLQGIKQNNRFEFLQLPRNEKIKILGLKIENGKYQIAIAEAYIRDRQVELQFKNVTVDELRAELTKLDQ